MVDHRAAQVGPGQRAHQGAVIDHRKSPDAAVDHHDRCPGEFISWPDRRRAAHDERVDDAVSEGAAALEEDAERVREGAPGRGHVGEAGQL
jgi:hypothetical protein